MVEGSSLQVAMTGSCRDAFLDLCQLCDSVLCCRLSPLQKAEVVRAMKNRDHAPTTLAVGDGANDVGMIQEAHIGIGIMGREGRQAVRVSDYAVSRFHFMRRLLLVHGRYCYIRMATMVLYFFYKNLAWINAQLYFAFLSSFSGQTIYSAMLLTFYNVAFTALPVLAYGVFEKDASPDLLMAVPRLYKSLSRNALLRWRPFLQWCVSGIWHSLAMFFGTLAVFGYGGSASPNGQATGGLWEAGTVMYTVCIVVVNLKLGLEMYHWTIPGHILLWGSILVYIPFMFFLSALPRASPEDYGVFTHIMVLPSFWLTLLLLVVLCLFPDYACKAVKLKLWPEGWQVLEWRKQKHDAIARNEGTVGLTRPLLTAPSRQYG